MHTKCFLKNPNSKREMSSDCNPSLKRRMRTRQKRSCEGRIDSTRLGKKGGTKSDQYNWCHVTFKLELNTFR